MAIVARKRKHSTCYLVVHRCPKGRQLWERCADEAAAQQRDPRMKAELEARTYVPTPAQRRTARSRRFARKVAARSR